MEAAAVGPGEFLWWVAGLLLVLPSCLSGSDSAAASSQVVNQESIKIKVNISENSGDIRERQVVLNITYTNGQVYINDFPLKSGVTRIKCQTLILDSENFDTLLDRKQIGIVCVRIMVQKWSMASNLSLQSFVIEEEVTEIDGEQVKQNEVIKIDLLVTDRRILRQINYAIPLEESLLYSRPRDNDILFTLPNVAGTDVESPLQTASHYLLRQVETTVDEKISPSKLPETPLGTLPPSSYKVMCQWVEDLRNKLCTFWHRSFPVFFNFMEVIVVGIIGAALIIKALKVFCPREAKGILQLDASVIPVDTKSLLPDVPEKTANINILKTCVL